MFYIFIVYYLCHQVYSFLKELPEDAEVIDTLATVYQSLGRYEEAMDQFLRCLKLKQEQNESDESIKKSQTKIAELMDLMDK